MPVVRMTREDRSRKLTRVMLYGAPNTFKTTAAILTSYYPMVILSVPGEHGYGTIPDNVPGLIPLIWRNNPGDAQGSTSVKTEVETEVKRVISGGYDKEYGKVRTLVIDGYHKLHHHYLNIVSGGKFNAGEKVEPFDYPRATRMSDAFLDLCLDSPVEYVTFTVWSALEPDKQGDLASTRHQWPDMPGRSAKDMVGKFSVVCASRVRKTDTGKLVGEWGLRPDLEHWGNSVKLDPRYIARLPATCPQDFKQLYKIIGAAQQEVESEDSPTVA